MGGLRVFLLGSFQALFGELPIGPFRTRKAQALLIYLSVEAISSPTVMHGREALMELLWPCLPLKLAQNNLRQTLYQLRKVVPPQVIDDDQDTIQFVISNRVSIGLNPEYELALDVSDFIRHLERNRFEEAANLYRGDFLNDFYLSDSNEFEEWAAAWRNTLRQQALDALNALTLTRLDQGLLNEAQRFARQQLTIDDLREGAYRQLMEALTRSGERSSAMATYEICRRRLAEDLNISPSEETEDVYERIVTDKVRIPATPEVHNSGTWPGTRADGPELLKSLAEDVGETAPVFVARERELAALEQALSDARIGRGQLRFVIGGAGRGKTALVTEFARRNEKSDPDLLVVSGYCRGQAGFGDPYLPFRQALAQLTGDFSSASGGTTLTNRQVERLWSAMPLTIPLLVNRAPDLIDTLLPGRDLRHRAATFAGPESSWFRRLSNHLDADRRTKLRQDRLFSQFTLFIQAITAERCLLVILEDLHYADPGSISLLFHLSRELSEGSMLLLATYRPEEIILELGRRKHPLANITGELKRRLGDIWLDLSQTTEAEGQAFVDALLDTEPNRLDASFRSALFDHAGGHALFTVELLRSMQERGDIVRNEEHQWVTGETINWHVLPAKVEGVIEQRLGRLDADLRDALTIASVEGESFTAEVVARVQRQEENRLVRQLSWKAEKQHRLVKSGSLGWVGRQRLSRYQFRHQLFQQYLYQNLDEAERAYLHEDVGRALDALYEEEVGLVASRLAWHFGQAGLAEKAIEYLTMAARQAVRLGANDQVIEHCTKGLALLSMVHDLAARAEQELALQIILGNVFVATKGYGSPEVKNAFDRASELCQQVGQTPQLSQVLFGLWGYYFHQAEHQIALELGEQALRLAEQQAEIEPRLNAHRLLGVTSFYLGQFSRSLEHMQQVVKAYDPSRHSNLGFVYGSDPCLSAYSYIALNLIYMGYPDQARSYSQRALQLAHTLAYPFAMAFCLLHTLWLNSIHDDNQATLEMVEEQIALSSEYGYPIHLAIAKYHKYLSHGLLGRPAESIPEMCQAIVDWQATGAQCGKAAILGGLAHLCLEAGEIESGLAYISEALDLIRQNGELYDKATLYWIRGQLLCEQGVCYQEVESNFRLAINIARNLEARLSELRVITSLSRLRQKQGRTAEARTELAAVFGWFSEGFDSPVLEDARQLLEELE